MAIVTRRQQYSSGTQTGMDQVSKQHGHVGPATPVIDAHNSNTIMSNAIPIQLNPSITQTCGQWREWKDCMVLAVMLTMVLVEHALTLLMVIEECWWYRNPSNQNTTALASETKNNNHTVAAERRPTNNGNHKMSEATQSACQTPETIQYVVVDDVDTRLARDVPTHGTNKDKNQPN